MVDFDADGFPNPSPGVSRPDAPSMDNLIFSPQLNSSNSKKILDIAISDEINHNLELAHKGFLAARDLASKEGEEETVKICNCYLARSYYRMGDNETAKTMLKVVIDSFIGHEEEYPDSWVFACLTISEIYKSEGNFLDALELLDSMMYSPILNATNYTLANLFINLGSIHIHLKNLKLGYQFILRAMEFSEDDFVFHFSCVQILCSAYIEAREWEMVSSLSETLLEISENQLGDSYSYEKAIAMEMRAIYLYESADIESARIYAHRAAESYANSGSKPKSSNLIKLINLLDNDKI